MRNPPRYALAQQPQLTARPLPPLLFPDSPKQPYFRPHRLRRRSMEPTPVRAQNGRRHAGTGRGEPISLRACGRSGALIPTSCARERVPPNLWQLSLQPCFSRTPRKSTQSQEEFKLEDLKKLEPILKNILTYNKEFPFDVQPVPLRKILAPGEEENLEFEEDDEDGGAGAGSPDSFPARVPGTLLPRLPSEPGMTLLTIRIEKIGLKDAGQCIDPYITVSVKDVNGVDLTPVQDTPVASRKEDTYVHFNVDIEIQKHVEKLTKGAAIFFEFKHYKPKKRFTSTKCFAFMEMDEIKPGTIVIELIELFVKFQFCNLPLFLPFLQKPC
ncbi:Axin interactor, dorsalization-associated protein [Chelonia mydas]|uniref:Axin interactor, dorsalization-associated protein n=1 Tax=Chelonia mydas TaxID=8469 RepID=M7BBY3_CHEMY|nr:Axin interactor, dorsalization-associated protein [Chelonia mydas]